jgi:hypothetical protein
MRGISKEIALLSVGLMIGAISILGSSAARDFIDSILIMLTPVNSKALVGWSLAFYHGLYLAIIVATLVAITILLL